jgi:hypothetical protein
METLHQKINPNKNQLKRFITSNAARELSALSEPCYYPKTKRFYFELLNIMKIKDKDIKEFVKRTYKGTKAEKWNLWRDPATNLLIFIMHYFLKERDQAAYSATMVYYMIIQYARLMNKQIKYCDPDAFKYTLDTLTRTHLFFREKTIPNSLYYLSGQMQNSFTNDFKEWDIERIIAFVSAARHRISQSVKSFAEHYYRNKKSGASIKTQGEDSDDEANSYQYQVLQKGQKVVDDVTKKITSYKIIDRKSFDEAKKITKIKTSIATIVADGVTNEKHFNNVKIALQLFVKEANSVSMVCGDDFYKYVKRLMAVKRTVAQLYFKSQINILLLDILKDSKFLKTYENYTPQTQFIINSFLAFYITIMLRRTLCQV